ncbi:MAG: hypothetical protein AAF564_22945 [Bacteroidota bacterium]
MTIKNKWLFAAGICSLLVAILHVFIIIGGAEWYRFFGAGEAFAQMDEAGSIYPALATAGITVVFALWAAYGFSGAGTIRRLPLLRIALVLIAGIYLIRGIGGIPLVLFGSDAYLQELSESPTFPFVSSLVSLAFGVLYTIGTKQIWQQLGARAGARQNV